MLAIPTSKWVQMAVGNLIGPVKELGALVERGFIAVWAFEAEAINWKIGLVEKKIEPSKKIARRCLSGWNRAVGEVLVAFRTCENPSRHGSSSVEEIAGRLFFDHTRSQKSRIMKMSYQQLRS